MDRGRINRIRRISCVALCLVLFIGCLTGSGTVDTAKAKTSTYWIHAYCEGSGVANSKKLVVKADVKKKKSHYRWAMTLCRMNVAAVVKNGYGSSRLVILIKDIFMKPFAKLVGRRRIAKSQRKHALKYRYGKAPECGMVTWAYDGPGQALTVSEYETLVELPFEGHSFFAMSAWDKNLSGIFGDYMQLPPEEDRITHELEAYRV